MKILFITDNFYPEVNAPASRTYEHCKAWVKEGHEVTVVTCNPNYPQGKVYPGYKNSFFSKTTYTKGIKVIRVWTYITKNEGVFRRTLDFISFAIASLLKGLFIKTDVIIATSPQFFTTVTGCILSFIKRKKWIFELRDLWPDTMRSMGVVKNRPLLYILESMELFLYRNAHMVIAVTDAFKINLIERGISPEKIKVVTNGVNLAHFKPYEHADELKEKLGLSGKFVAGYIGTHGISHNLEGLISEIPETENIHFIFIGDGASKELMQATARVRGLQNVTFLDPVSKNEIPKYWSIIDVALVPLRKTETFKTVIPSKIFEACAMQKPILLGVDGQARHIVEAYGAGLYFEPESTADMMDKLMEIKNDPALRLQLMENCLELAYNYDRNTLAGNMLDHIIGTPRKRRSSSPLKRETQAVGMH